MKIARILRPLWSSKKSEKLDGVRILEAEILPWGDPEKGKSVRTVVVCDNLGAGVGELVFICEGSAVRDVVFFENAPFKLVVTAIVDQIFLDEGVINDKARFQLLEKVGR